jgi:hypothetical protein
MYVYVCEVSWKLVIENLASRKITPSLREKKKKKRKRDKLERNNEFY